MTTENKRYGYYGINGVYYVYDHKNNNIPAGYGYKEYKTKKACLIEAERLNQLNEQQLVRED